jgi:alkaline phosphatase D
MKNLLITITLSLTIFSSYSSAKAPKIDKSENTEVLTKIACGSCFRSNYKSASNVWPIIASSKPQLFLFMGDNIYADTHDMDVMRKKYQTLTELPAYAKFSKEYKVIPVWDDHDYGMNDAGQEYPEKAEAQKIFQDAHGFAEDHPARTRKGTYHTYTQGPKGKVTQIINLDTRYHRSALDRRKVGRRSKYFPVTDSNATMLGAEQWAWLEKELKKPADLRIIVSSIQVISTEHPYEKWENIPAERKRFIALLKKCSVKRAVLLSGDRHMTDISKLSTEVSGLGFDLLEMTSSGLTHAGSPKSPNKYQVEGSFANIKNFGILEIDWSQKIPQITLVTNEIRDKNFKPLIRVQTNFKE